MHYLLAQKTMQRPDVIEYLSRMPILRAHQNEHDYIIRPETISWNGLRRMFSFMVAHKFQSVAMKNESQKSTSLIHLHVLGAVKHNSIKHCQVYERRHLRIFLYNFYAKKWHLVRAPNFHHFLIQCLHTLPPSLSLTAMLDDDLKHSGSLHPSHSKSQ